MKIAVNARFLLKDRLEGLGRFSHEVLREMSTRHPEHEFHFLFDRPYDPSFLYASNVVPHVLYPPARHPYLYYLWFEWAIPFAFRRIQPDAFLSPDGFLSLSTQVPSLPVIHDLAFEHFPQYVSKTGARYYRHWFPRFARHAARIATVSEYTRQDIHRLYDISSDSIDVVYNGAGTQFYPDTAEEQVKTRKIYSDGAPFFLYVGALQPRKNMDTLLLAFDRFKATDDAGYRLIVCGREAWQTESMKAVYDSMTFRDHVSFTGRVSDETLRKLLSAARALTYVPHFEGFGLPLVEAFRCGTPALTAYNSSLPEVGGHAALYADSTKVEEIAGQLKILARDEAVYLDLKSHCQDQATKFTWEKTAGALWESLEKILP